MKYDLKNAFTHITTDEHWIKKLILGGLILLLAILLFFTPWLIAFVSSLVQVPTVALVAKISFFICLIASALVWFVVNGYTVQYAHDYTKNTESKMPAWANFKNLFFIGFKEQIGYVLLYIPFILLAIIAMFLTGVIAGLLPLVTSFSNANVFQNIAPQFWSHLFEILYGFVVVAFGTLFVKEFKLFESLNPINGWKLIKNNTKDYFVLVLLLFAIQLLFVALAVLAIISVIGVILVPFLFLYTGLVTMNLIAQFNRICDSKTLVVEEQQEG